MKQVYDIETYPNFFCIVFYDIELKEFTIFEISDRVNEGDKLIEYIKNNKLMLIGFNNVNFDYPLLHNTILIKRSKPWTALEIFNEAQSIIESKYSAIWDNQVKIPQLDLYKIWHYDNKNKATSLKWLEFAIRSKDVRDLPYPVGSFLTEENMDEVISYCKHDVLETYKFYTKSLKHIEIRQFYTKEEGINVINASETRMAKDIFGKYLSKDMGIDYNKLRKMRTYRKSINIADIIFPYINFKHKQNIAVLDYFNSIKWNPDTKISYSTDYLNVKREYGEGGLHSFVNKSTIFESNDDYIVYDLDFASFYPHLSFKNKLHPEHIPEKIFSEKYEGFYNERKNYPKSDPRNYVLKILLNSAYGLSKDQYSYLYDPKWQLAITINGQLLLSMLTEKVVDATSYCKICFENTDGAAYVIKRSEKKLVDKVCEEMAKLSGIALESQIYDKLIMRDVNNYIAIKGNDIKFKGAFEIDRDYHKNHSKRIVPIALANYFIDGIVPELTIQQHIDRYKYGVEDKNYKFAKNYGIFDFCLGSKMKGQNKLFKREIKGLSIIDTELARMNRYYISKEGYELIKKLPPLEKNRITDTDKAPFNQTNIFDIVEDVQVEPKDRETNIEASWKCLLFNKYHENEYLIDYRYYIKEAYKVINLFK